MVVHGLQCSQTVDCWSRYNTELYIAYRNADEEALELRNKDFRDLEFHIRKIPCQKAIEDLFHMLLFSPLMTI